MARINPPIRYDRSHTGPSNAHVFHDYQVIVGNIGTVYSGPNGFEANKAYNSNYDGTRADGSVTLMKDGDIAKERQLTDKQGEQ